jgi:hypothetical protein
MLVVRFPNSTTGICGRRPHGSRRSAPPRPARPPAPRAPGRVAMAVTMGAQAPGLCAAVGWGWTRLLDGARAEFAGHLGAGCRRTQDLYLIALLSALSARRVRRAP